MRLFTLVALLIIGSSGARAATEVGESMNQMDLADSIIQKDGFTVQADLQFFSLAGNGSPLIGPSIAYQVFDSDHAGLRTILSITRGGEAGAYSAQMFWRHEFSHKQTRLFAEPSWAVNRADFQNFSSLGAVVGVLHRYDNDVAFGGATGLEMTGQTSRGAVISMGDTQESNLFIAPKVMFFGNYAF